MQNKTDVERSFHIMKRQAELVGLDLTGMELRWGGASSNVNHALLGPQPGFITYLGTSYGNACRYLDGMARGFELLRWHNAQREAGALTEAQKRADAADVAAATDPNVVRLSDPFEVHDPTVPRRIGGPGHTPSPVNDL